ncbi:NADH-quinone oxidoreductase subunit C [Oceanispirochaeta sp.]|jgi:Ni,Fe-hydrogenase III large subunit|uniref:hydrogenase large subunit n=1 Tax=Oceanispirochaeta sp. TaxID=2035350 RepID=UPI0026304A0D|nr:NADH-quinone oxidoreductase subunit C [Oceanispirochaeta sp.]MDA3955265.1 NADH-quinone oxidoreductase subunit C [Oceanispirochaeta sp.]
MKQIYENLAVMTNGDSILINEIPICDITAFTATIIDAVDKGQRVSSFFGAKTDNADSTALYVILADDESNRLNVGKTIISGTEFPSITPHCPQVHLFEREIAEQFGIIPIGHPWFKPVRYCHSWTGMDAWNRNKNEPILPAVGDFYRIEGEQIHEVAVGPVHAGVIEPGHYRFQCHGEQVFHLEIALGFQHRGVEKAMETGPDSRSLHFMETLAGDTTIGHSISYCQIYEAFSHTQKPVRAQALRGIALELERLANHVGDLGALSGDVGFLPTSSFCGRLRGEFLNLTAYLCGNRFGRGFILPGGVGFDIDQQDVGEILHRIGICNKEITDAINLLWDNQSVMARFTDTGPISEDFAIEMGLVGPVARASGIMRDVRYTHPNGIFRFSQIPVSIYESGDVLGRAYVRWMEIQKSISFIINQLKTLPKGDVLVLPEKLNPLSLSIALNEGWRGEICHVALTDENGSFARYKIVDPSFHNWQGLAQALRNQEISDFPLCNKSFNLSYCGHDL